MDTEVHSSSSSSSSLLNGYRSAARRCIDEARRPPLTLVCWEEFIEPSKGATTPYDIAAALLADAFDAGDPVRAIVEDTTAFEVAFRRLRPDTSTAAVLSYPLNVAVTETMWTPAQLAKRPVVITCATIVRQLGTAHLGTTHLAAEIALSLLMPDGEQHMRA